MKKIKSKHLWRRGATLLLAMLMLFTCVGSALPAFAEEATGNTATVDSGDPVLADSSAGGDSTGDTDADLPDDTPQRPTLPSGEDISEETPPADESDGETVPPADSDSSEEPAAPDSGDSIPDESESEPTEQPGEGDADLPEDEQPGGEEPDPDEDEEIPEDEPEDVPFEALVILDPENGATVQAEVGEEVTFKAPVNREDVAVAYQWQRFQKPAQGSAHTEALYDYAEGETTEYWYALDDMREAEALAMNPDMLWPGIEMYYATVAALDEIGADSSDVSVAWRTPNFALEGYTISAAETEGGIEIYADKDDERHVTDINVDSTGGGFLITDKAPLDLLRGEMSMNMFGTQLVPGANTPANPERWIAAADASGGVDGVFLHLPLECYIASGNVNDETVCTPVAKVQYTIAEYGKTVPEVDDAELPEYIHGEPVTPSTTG